MKETISLQFYHSVPSFFVAGRECRISVIVPIRFEGEVLPSVTVSPEGKRGESICLSMCRNLVFGDGVFACFEASLPASFFTEGETFSYQIRADGKNVGTYGAPVVSALSSENMPPLAITEIFARPKSSVPPYFEVVNPSASPVDLYDYKLVRCRGEVPKDEETPFEVRLAPVKDTILMPGELAVLCFVPASIRNQPDYIFGVTEETLKERFSQALAEIYPNVPVDSLRTVFVDNVIFDHMNGVYVDRPQAFIPPVMPGRRAWTFAIAKANEPASKAVYSMTYGLVPFSLETPTRRSSVWGIDPLAPTRGVRLSPAEIPTPGSFHAGQAVPDFSDLEAPVILPLTVMPYYFSCGKMHMKFAVLDQTVTSAELHIKDTDGTFRTFRAYPEGEEDVYEAEVPYEFLSRLGAMEYYITARDSYRTASLGSETQCLHRILFDNAGPQVLSVEPARGFGEDRTRTPKIRLTYFDRAGVNVLKGKLKLDAKDVTDRATWYSDAVVYTPDKPLAFGNHKITLTVYDLIGNKTIYTSVFSIASGETLSCYKGEVHTHTMESDGSGLPEDAMQYARDEGKVDFFAITEHSHYLSKEAYARQIEIADQFNVPGQFAALYGWEMTWNNTNGFWGHMNILGTKDIVQDIDAVPLPEIYEFLGNHPEAVAMFNHPGLGWGNFDDYAYKTPGADRGVCLSEIKGAGYDYEYALMLAKGWHAGPVFNEDNHSPNWTTATPATGYVLAPALTRENVMDAFRRRRTYTTSDDTLKLYYRVNGAWLGATLKNPESLSISVKVSTENPNGLGKLQIVAEDNIVVAEEDVGAKMSYEWDLTLPPMYDYYYVRILAEKAYTVTAPVWIERDQPLSIRHIRVFHNENRQKPNAVAVRLDNLGDKVMKNIEVKFYFTDRNGFVLSVVDPYETVYLDKIKAKESICVTRLFPNINRRARVTAIVRGEVDGKTVQCTEYVLLSPLDITAVATNTASLPMPDGTNLANPFPYIQLFNTSSVALDLSDATLRLWTTTGKPPQEGSILPLRGVVIPPRAPFVIWKKPKGSALKVEDFNAHYGTRFVEGKDILVTEMHVVSASKPMRRIDVVNPYGTLARVNYNMGLDIGKDVDEGAVLYYRYTPNMTGNAVKLTATGAAMPNFVSDGQKARDFVYFEKKSEAKGALHAEKRMQKAKKKAGAPKIDKNSALAMAAAAAAGAAALTATVMKTVSKKK